MNITLSIDNNGQSRGSLGWLCKNIGSIKIGTIKTDNQAAWILDKNGKVITVLAVRDYWRHSSTEIETVVNQSDENYQGLISDIPFTDAAWEIVKQCRTMAIEQMNESSELADNIEIVANNKNVKELKVDIQVVA